MEAFSLLSDARHLNVTRDDWEDDLRSRPSTCGEGGGGSICLLLHNIPMTSVADYSIRDSRIRSNGAVVGGGVYVAVMRSPLWNTQNNDQGQCSDDVQFDICRSLRFMNVTIDANTASSAAGGIFINTPSALMLQCNARSNAITLLAATNDGQTELNETEFCGYVMDNTVEETGFGPNFGGNVNRLMIEPEHATIINHTSGAVLLPNCRDCPINQTEGIVIRVMDYFNQVITGGIPDAALAVTIISENILGDRRYVADRGIIHVNNTLGIGIGITNATMTIEAVQNRDLFADMTFSTRECFPGEEQGDLECDVCNPLQYSFDPTSDGCIPCEDNAVCTGGAALVPIDGFWHSTPFSPQFHECIIREACSYTHRVSNLSAFYANRHLLDEQLKTVTATIEAGIVPREFPNYHQCSDGYKGILCGSCEDGYGHLAGGECVDCPMGTTGSIFISILISMWMAAFIGVNIFTANSSIRRKIRLVLHKRSQVNYQMVEMQPSGSNGPPSEAVIPAPTQENGDLDIRIKSMIKLTETLKILVNYLQVTSVALSINLNWLSIIKTLLSIQMMLVGVTSGSRFVPLDCTFKDQDNDSGKPNSIKVLWFRATFPLIVLCFFILVACLDHLRRQQRHGPNARDRSSLSEYITIQSNVVVIFVVVLFFSYINITSEFMRTVNCIKVDEKSKGHIYDIYAVETGNRIWAEDTELHCFSGDHTATGVFGILGLVFFSLGVILLIFFGLTINRSHLKNPRFIANFGFIYQGYKKKCPTIAWEAVVTLRKALVSAAVVYAFPLGPNLQGVCALGVLMVALAVHLLFLPFKDFDPTHNVPDYAGRMFRTMGMDHWSEKWRKMNDDISLNYLEAASLMMSIVVFYAGILFNDDNTSDSGKRSMAAFTFIVNIAFVLYVLYRLYYGAHVAVDQYCHRLRNHEPARESVKEGEGMVGLVKKALTIYRFRDLFETEQDIRNSRRFRGRIEERI